MLHRARDTVAVRADPISNERGLWPDERSFYTLLHTVNMHTNTGKHNFTPSRLDRETTCLILAQPPFSYGSDRRLEPTVSFLS